MNTETWIDVLATDTVVSWKPDRSVGLAVVAGAMIAGVIFFAAIGFRSDIMSAVETVRFLVKFAVTVPLALGAIVVMRQLVRPVPPAGWERWTLAISPAILIAAVVIELVIVPPSLWPAKMIGTNARNCLTLIPLLAIGPLACLLLALRNGAPTRPGLAGAIAGLAASGLAATFYATNCTDDSPLFVVTWYPLAIGVVTLIGYLGGVRWLRW